MYFFRLKYSQFRVTLKTLDLITACADRNNIKKKKNGLILDLSLQPRKSILPVNVHFAYYGTYRKY